MTNEDAHQKGHIQTGSRNSVGHDKIVHGNEVHGDKVAGDKVGRDKIAVGDITGSLVAIGAGAQVIYRNVERALTEVEVAEQTQAFERKQLAQAVTTYVEQLQRQAEKAQDKTDYGSPYKALLEYDIDDTALFYGRSAAIEALLDHLERGPLTVLHGDSWVGKTSLLKAGIVPRLLADGHVPLYVRPHSIPVHQAVKYRLLPKLETQPNLAPNLAAASLRSLLGQVTDLLGGRRLVVLLDQLEQVFTEQSDAVCEDFRDQLARCLDDDMLPVHWILSVRGESFSQLSCLKPAVRDPFANEYRLPPLSRGEARVAILEPAELRGISLEDDLHEVILDDLGGDAINPFELQLVCHTLASGLKPDEDKLTLAAYEHIGRAEGVLRNHLDIVLKRNLPRDDRELAWQLLACIVDLHNRCATETELVTRLKVYDFSEADTRRVLGLLEANRLVRLSEGCYRLTSDSLLPRIQQWANQRAVDKQLREEAMRQAERIRGSALRGLLFGIPGFILAFLATFGPQYNYGPFFVYSSIAHAVPGAVAGLLIILFIDLALASYHGPHRWKRYVVGGVAGAGSFAFAVLFHTYLQFDLPLYKIPLSTAEGAAWGLVTGVGAVWIISGKRPLWQTFPLVIVACALTLWLADKFGHAFGEPTFLGLIAAGAVMPLFLIGSVLWGRERRMLWKT